MDTAPVSVIMDALSASWNKWHGDGLRVICPSAMRRWYQKGIVMVGHPGGMM